MYGSWLPDPLVELNLSDEHKAALITVIEDVFMPTAHTSPGTNTMRECQADLNTESRMWSCQRTALKTQPVDRGDAVVASTDHNESVGFNGKEIKVQSLNCIECNLRK